MDALTKALQISIIGVGLVFLGILILWGLMELVAALTAPKGHKAAAEKPEKPRKDLIEFRRKAAAAAVVTAMALQKTAFASSIHRKREIITPWQAAHRSRQLHSAHEFTTRKRKG